MKKAAMILLAIGLVVVSCKKETPQPNAPVAPLQDTVLPDTTGNGNGGTGTGGNGGGGTTVNNNLGREFLIHTFEPMANLDTILIVFHPKSNGVWQGPIDTLIILPTPTQIANIGNFINFSALDIITTHQFANNGVGVLYIELHLKNASNQNVQNMYSLASNIPPAQTGFSYSTDGKIMGTY